MGDRPHLPSQSPRGEWQDLGVSQWGGDPISAHIFLPGNIKSKQWGPASEHPKLDTMKIPVLPAVVLLSLLALHSAQGATLGSSEVSTSPGFSFSYTYYLNYSSISLLSIHYWLSGSYFWILSGAGWEAWALRKGRKEEGNKAFLGRPVGKEMLFLEGMVKYGVKAGVWVQLHLCFIHIPGNGFQVTGSSLLPLEPRP